MIFVRRHLRIAIALVVIILTVLLVAAGAFPASWLKGFAERKLSEEFGRPVTIATLDREGVFSLTPVIRVTGIEIPQESWVGEGKLASIGLLRVRIAVLPAIFGRADPQLLSAEGVVLDLVRDADRRVNWGNGESGEDGADHGISLAAIQSVKADVRYRDAFQKRSLRIQVTTDPRQGVTAAGSGEIDGNPVTLMLKGPASQGDERWPFEASISGPAIDMRMKGSMAAPLRTDDLSLRMTARARDLKLVDRVVEAGLFGTQPVDLAANVSHKARRWTISDLSGTIGSSPLTGRLTVDKADGRSRLDGDIRFSRLDFDDLATDAGQAAARALQQAEGQRLVPDTRINIRKIKKTDGRIAVRIDDIVSRGGSALRGMEGVLTLNDRLLIAKPLTLRLSRGVIGGEVRVDQQKGQAEPTVTLALDMRGSSIDALAGGSGEIDAPVDGRIRLVGVGSTIREVVGKSDGTIGVFASQGSLPAKLARLLGFDVGRGLFTGGDEQATLRCAGVRLTMKRGVGTAEQLVVDTSESQTRGVGTVTFPEERIALTLTGAPKSGSVLRLPGSVSALGTLRDPSVVIPRDVRSVGNVLKAVGRALTGRQGPEATDADCAALRGRALGAGG
jgi:AsmA family protein